MQWNVLIVDDEPDQAATTKDIFASDRTARLLGEGSTINTVLASGFAEALEMIEYTKFDLIILDLKDEDRDGDDPNAELSGERVLAQLRGRQFTPVIFYTGYPQKVEDRKGPFVKVVSKGSGPQPLRDAVQSVWNTNLPRLIRHLQEEQRKYLWEHVEQATSHPDHGDTQPNELAFLLGRRLANALAGKEIRRFFDAEYQGDNQIVHPVELYIWPPMGESVGFGDILEKTEEKTKKYFVVLNPACDFFQCKAEQALLAECELLENTPEVVAIANHRLQSDDNPSNTVQKALRALMSDNRQGKGVQSERYKFLPGTSFLPNLVVDYQKLIQVPVSKLDKTSGYSRLTTLDTPFAEAVQSRYTRYYGRIGTPDLEFDILMAGVINALPKKG
jgi:CheY-like chemotaxis protein